MPEITFKVIGETKWLSGILEDTAIKPFSFHRNPPEAKMDVDSGALATVSIYFYGEPGTALNLEVIKSGKTIDSRHYKIDPDGSGGRALQFDPDA